MSSAPLVSVLMPTYRHRAFVAQAIESVLAQQAPFAIELLVSDDASPDDTGEIVMALAAAHPGRIRAFRQPKNLGGPENIRFLFTQARGRYVALLEGDDYWLHPEKLARQVALLEADPALAATGHLVSVVNNAGEHQRYLGPSLDAVYRLTLEMAIGCNAVHVNSLVFRRDVVPAPPAWAAGLYMLDWPLLVELTSRAPVLVLPEAMTAYRVHEGGVWSSASHARRVGAIVDFYDRVERQYQPPAGSPLFAQRKIMLFELFRSADAANERATARHWLARYWSARPNRWRLPEHQARAILRALTGWPRASANDPGPASATLPIPR